MRNWQQFIARLFVSSAASCILISCAEKSPEIYEPLADAFDRTQMLENIDYWVFGGDRSARLYLLEPTIPINAGGGISVSIYRAPEFVETLSHANRFFVGLDLLAISTISRKIYVTTNLNTDTAILVLNPSSQSLGRRELDIAASILGKKIIDKLALQALVTQSNNCYYSSRVDEFVIKQTLVLTNSNLLNGQIDRNSKACIIGGLLYHLGVRNIHELPTEYLFVQSSDSKNNRSDWATNLRLSYLAASFYGHQNNHDRPEFSPGESRDAVMRKLKASFAVRPPPNE